MIDIALRFFIDNLESPSLLCLHSYFFKQVILRGPENALNPLHTVNISTQLIYYIRSIEIVVIPVSTPHPTNFEN